MEDKEIKISDQPNNNYDTEIESFKSLAGDSDADVLEAFIQQISSGVKDSLSPVILSPSSDKSHRTVSFEFKSSGLSIIMLFLFIILIFVWLYIVDYSLLMFFRQCIIFSKSISNSLSPTQ